MTDPRLPGTSPDLPPAAGPYSHSVRLGGLVHTAGQGPARADGTMPEGIRAQTTQCLTNVMTALAASGATQADVLRVGVFLTDTADFAEMNAVYAEFFEAPYPVRTTVYVGLPPGLLVEIDALAVAPEATP